MLDERPCRPRVALFATNFLPFSQTFVHDELRCHRRYDAEVFARRRRLADEFPFAPVHLANPLYGVSAYSPAFHRRIREGRFAVVHAHFGPGAVYARPYAQRADLPLVVTFHGYDVPLLWTRGRFTDPENWPYALGARRMLARMTLGLCVSQELRELLVRHGVPRERLRLHHLGIDLGNFSPGSPHGEFKALMVGRFVEKKGFEFGLRGFAGFLARGGAGRLTVVGEGPREGLLRRTAGDLRLGDRVEFVGRRTSAEVRGLMRASHVLLAPSVVARDEDREGGLTVAKEASACGTVVVGSVHGGTPEIVEHGVTGLLAPERDPAGLADHLLALARDPRLRARLAAAAVDKMRREYDLQDSVDRLEDFYDEARALHRAADRPAEPEPACVSS